jgi:hypothetical protein
MEAGAEDDTSWCFKEELWITRRCGGILQRTALKSPRVEAVEEFRKAVEESEKAAAQKQHQ